MTCPYCGRAVKTIVIEYESDYLDKCGIKIKVPDVKNYLCMNCDHHWLPHEEDMKIDKYIEEHRA